MALPTSGQITWEMIRAEFGGTYPIYANQYYRGGPLVPDIPANSRIPVGSGPLSAWQFLGASKGSAPAPLSAYFSPSFLYNHNPTTSIGQASVQTRIIASGGTGTYTVTSLTKSDSRVTITNSGLIVTLSGSGRNSSLIGSFTAVVSDGVSSVTITGTHEFVFGVLV